MRNFHRIDRTFTRLAIDGDFTLMGMYDLLSQHHPDAVSTGIVFIASPIERRKQVLHVIGIHTDTRVRKADNRLLLPKADLNERSVIGGELAIVLHQIDKKLFSTGSRCPTP